MSSRPKILALLALYKEQRYLPGYFENLAGRVDGVIALDDGSTDGSRSLVVAEPLTLELLTNAPEDKTGWDEPANRRDLITAGQAAAADWFLTIDADERVEDRFWDELDTIISWADSHDVISCSFHLRELWGSVDTYRVDGLWGRKTKAAFFRNLGPDHQFDDAEWHGEWVPMQSWNTPACRTIPYNLYHLKMIHSVDRESRRQRYEQVDPTGEFQPVGYAYLTDVNGLELARLPPDAAPTSSGNSSRPCSRRPWTGTSPLCARSSGTRWRRATSLSRPASRIFFDACTGGVASASRPAQIGRRSTTCSARSPGTRT